MPGTPSDQNQQSNIPPWKLPQTTQELEAINPKSKKGANKKPVAVLFVVILLLVAGLLAFLNQETIKERFNLKVNNSVTNKINPFSKSLDLGNCPAMFGENKIPKKLGKYTLTYSEPDVNKVTYSTDQRSVGGESERRLESLILRYVYPDRSKSLAVETILDIDLAQFESSKPLEANLEKLNAPRTDRITSFSKKELGGHETYFIEEEAKYNGKVDGWLLTIYTGINDKNSRIIFNFITAGNAVKPTLSEAESLYKNFFGEVCS